MLNIEKLEQECKEIERKIEKATFIELKKIIRDCNQKINGLNKRKSNLKNEQDVLSLKNAIKRIKKVKRKALEQMRQKEEKSIPAMHYEKQRKENRIEEKELNLIIESTQTKEEKRKQVEEFRRSTEAKIEYDLAQIENLILVKRNTGIYLTASTNYDIEKQIRYNRKEIKYQTYLLQKCGGLLVQLRQENNIRKQKRKAPEREKEEQNTTYYKIMEVLLTDDTNYLFLKELIHQNKNFLNARSTEKEPILLEILDRYIKNKKLELVNQKVVHENPNFFYSLLKIFLECELDLSYEEELQFTNRLENFLEEIKAKKYSKAPRIKEEVYALLEQRKTIQNAKIDTDLYQRQLNELALATSYKRVDLTKETLEKIADQIATFKEAYFLEKGKYPTEEEIKNTLQIPVYTIRNSENPVSSFALENTPFAFSFGYDKEYNTYFRIHVIDTTLLNEESTCCKQMIQNKEATSPCVKKALKWKPNAYYPVITYQLKIGKEGNMGAFKIFESVINIEEVYKNKDFLNYREKEVLKFFVGRTRMLANFYNLDFEEITCETIHKIIDNVLNYELKNYFIKNNLPSLYYTELELNEEKRDTIHNQVCYLLGKIPKMEAHHFLRLLNTIPSSRFYTKIPLEESKIELDPRNYIGYLNLLVLKCRLHKMFTPLKKEIFTNDFTELEKSINNDAIFLDYFTNRKLIRKKKEEKNE